MPRQPARRLGRGLNSLITSTAVDLRDQPAQHPEQARESADAVVRQVPVDLIDPNPRQPRKRWDTSSLDELADSIRTTGIIQPVVVRQQGARFELIAGERRWRAAKQAGLDRVPAILRDATDRELIELALIENIHRSDLNPIERAEAYAHYKQQFELTDEQVAQRLGHERSTVTNYLRLLDLTSKARSLVAEGALQMGHAKAILGLGDPLAQEKLAARTVAEGLSVREVERFVKQSNTNAPGPRAPKVKRPLVADLETQLSAALGTKVAIVEGRKKNTGRIVIEYYSIDDFERIAQRLGYAPERA